MVVALIHHYRALAAKLRPLAKIKGRGSLEDQAYRYMLERAAVFHCAMAQEAGTKTVTPASASRISAIGSYGRTLG